VDLLHSPRSKAVECSLPNTIGRSQWAMPVVADSRYLWFLRETGIIRLPRLTSASCWQSARTTFHLGDAELSLPRSLRMVSYSRRALAIEECTFRRISLTSFISLRAFSPLGPGHSVWSISVCRASCIIFWSGVFAHLLGRCEVCGGRRCLYAARGENKNAGVTVSDTGGDWCHDRRSRHCVARSPEGATGRM
jgi:hypothetical protein